MHHGMSSCRVLMLAQPGSPAQPAQPATPGKLIQPAPRTASTGAVQGMAAPDFQTLMSCKLVMSSCNALSSSPVM